MRRDAQRRPEARHDLAQGRSQAQRAVVLDPAVLDAQAVEPAAVALLGPTSQEAALQVMRPRVWLAAPAGLAMVFLLLLIGGRLQNVIIYFQF